MTIFVIAGIMTEEHSFRSHLGGAYAIAICIAYFIPIHDVMNILLISY